MIENLPQGLCRQFILRREIDIAPEFFCASQGKIDNRPGDLTNGGKADTCKIERETP
jgi:hypothetical protein